MNLSKIFSKSPGPTGKKSSSTSDAHTTTNSISTPPPSPHKTPTPSSASKEKSRGEFRRPHKKKQNSKSSKAIPPNLVPAEYPRNLPPEEQERLSAMSTMSEPTPMDIDNEFLSSPSQVAPGAFPDLDTVNGAAEENDAPIPPPHKSPITSPSPQPQEPILDAETCKAQGNKYFKAKQYDKAIDEYSKAIEIKPDAATYRSNRAAALISASRYGEALEDAKTADELDPFNEKILHRLARVYTSLGRPKEALDVYSRIPGATAKDKTAATVMQQHISQAESALREGTTGSLALHALDQAERALGSRVSTPRKWRLMRGEAYLKMGTVNALGDAQSVAMSLLRENNADPEALVLRGRALYAQGDNAKGIQHFRQAVSCDPDYSDAIKWLRIVQKLDRLKEEGNTLFKSNKFQEAVDTYTKALEVDPTNKGTNSKILQNRAMCYTKLKQYSSAIEDCDRALALDPSYTKARLTRARALGASGDWEAAVRELKAHAENSPHDPSIAKEIRNAELELKKSKRKDYYKILEVDKDAGEFEIKRAYKKLAIQHHPDKNIGVEGAEERFKDVSEAYETLSDPQKRQRYDSGEDLVDPSDMFTGGGFGGMGRGMQIDPEMLFNMMGGMGGMGGGRGGSPQFSFSAGGSPFAGAGGRQRGGPPGSF